MAASWRSTRWASSASGRRAQARTRGRPATGRVARRATLTDALLVLGHLNPDELVGGDVLLDARAARNAITEQVAIPLGASPIEAA